MTKRSPAICTLSPSQVAAFRLQRHHLTARREPDLIRVSAEVCGIQAQLMPAAHLALWARTRNLAPATIEAALWRDRTLVKTLCMRQTLHLLPATEHSLYMAAVRRSRVAAIVRIMARFEITHRDTETLNRATLEMLEGGPLTLRDLAARVRPRVSRRVRAWMDRVWNPMRLALAAGLVCYGPDSGREVTLVRVDQWLPRLKSMAENPAKRLLLIKYLRAYGPATLRDFSHWSGIPVNEARDTWDASADDLGQVRIEGREAWALREDLKTLAHANLTSPVVRLLPAFDSFLLAHAEKDHLVAPRFYKRVYRAQGWVLPVLLLDGIVVGTWSRVRRGPTLAITVRPFAKLSRRVREGIEQEAASLGRFLSAKPNVEISRP
ncbi:MAG TPA: winged helix DNA-binding domain-containing protein [Candidatus Acidoferrales bacterium]|nr:winged helix DNA-binding domain-containing protein [Candidatus Acidoferrales bacterium]